MVLKKHSTPLSLFKKMYLYVLTYWCQKSMHRKCHIDSQLQRKKHLFSSSSITSIEKLCTEKRAWWQESARETNLVTMLLTRLRRIGSTVWLSWCFLNLSCTQVKKKTKKSLRLGLSRTAFTHNTNCQEWILCFEKSKLKVFQGAVLWSGTDVRVCVWGRCRQRTLGS